MNDNEYRFGKEFLDFVFDDADENAQDNSENDDFRENRMYLRMVKQVSKK